MQRAVKHWHGPNDRGGYLKAIHALGRSLGLADDVRRDLQQQLVGTASTKDMNLVQLSQVYQRLSTLAHDAGLTRPRPRKRPGRDERLPADPPTKEQLEKIEHLYADLDVRPSADMMALCRRITGHPWPQSRAEANQLIEGLKAMRKRGWKAKAEGRS